MKLAKASKKNNKEGKIMTNRRIEELNKDELELALRELNGSIDIFVNAAKRVEEQIANGEITEKHYEFAMDYYASMIDEMRKDVLRLTKRLKEMEKDVAGSQPEA